LNLLRKNRALGLCDPARSDGISPARSSDAAQRRRKNGALATEEVFRPEAEFLILSAPMDRIHFDVSRSTLRSPFGSGHSFTPFST